MKWHLPALLAAGKKLQMCCQQVLVMAECCESNDCSRAGPASHPPGTCQLCSHFRDTLDSPEMPAVPFGGALYILGAPGGHSMEPTDGQVQPSPRTSVSAFQGSLPCHRKALEWQTLTVRLQLYPRSLHLYRKDLLACSDCLPMGDRN